MSRNSLTRNIRINLIYLEQAHWTPKQLDVEFCLFAVYDDGDDFIQVQQDFNITYAKVTTMLHGFLDESLVMDPPGYHTHIELLDTIGNNVVTLPMVTDSQLATALFMKIMMICGEHTMLDYVKITDTEMGVSWRHEYTGEAIDISTLDQDYMGEFSIWSKPWWLRDDCIMYDNAASDQQSLQEMRDCVSEDTSAADIWREIESSVIELYQEESGSEPDPEPASKGSRVHRVGDVIHVDFSTWKK